MRPTTKGGRNKLTEQECIDEAIKQSKLAESQHKDKLRAQEEEELRLILEASKLEAEEQSLKR